MVPVQNMPVQNRPVIYLHTAALINMNLIFKPKLVLIGSLPSTCVSFDEHVILIGVGSAERALHMFLEQGLHSRNLTVSSVW